MTRLLLILSVLLVLPCFASPWDEYAPYAKSLPALDPTPSGDSHMGIIESGKPVQFRFPVPTEAVAAYRVNLSSVVAYSGKGQSYQLVIRADKPDGTVVHEGPVIQDGDAWNATNRDPVDLTAALKPDHHQQGYVDLYVTGIITGDGWTVYKSSPGRPIVAQAVVLTPEMEKQIEAARQMSARGVAVIPQPQQCALREGDVALSGFATEAKTAGEKFLRAEVNDRVKELGLPELKQDSRAGRIWLCRADDKVAVTGLRKIGFAAKPSGHAQGYTLEVGKAGVAVVGDDEEGLFYGVQTLRQLLKAKAGGVRAPALQVPALRITDWPDYPLRGWQYDIARGQTINLDFCKRLVRESARHKMNCIMLYMEGDFIFEKYPFVGREGTFDKQKALALDTYATQYYLQLIPQYEALGHASATLKHEEMKDLRENGNSWVYCTSEPKTWEFFDDVFGELAAAFPHCTYFHVGADEFEGGFALCPRCKPKGVGPCYVEHMTKLNNICKKYGRKMLFWPSHHADRDEISYLSLKYAKDMPKDCIPTEWIYHGPAAYPEIEQYQQAGYEDVIVSPAVVDYSVIWPDYVTTFRGIKGFYEAGRMPALLRPCGGAICTTWELMYGGLYENSWYGLMYSAECGWSLGRTSKGDYDRRFAADWFGITAPDAADLVVKALYTPIPTTGEAAFWRNGTLVQKLLWCQPQDFRRVYMQREPIYLQKAPALAEACKAWGEAIQTLTKQAKTNRSTLQFAQLGRDMYALVAAKLTTFDQAATAYGEAQKALAEGDAKAAGDKLQAVADDLRALQAGVDALKPGFQYAVDNMGAYQGDLANLTKQSENLKAMAAKLDDLKAQIAAGTLKELPAAAALGLDNRQITRIATWDPSQMSEQDKEIRYDITPFIKSAGTYRLEWSYTRGAHALAMWNNQLLANGQVVAEDNHRGHTGASNGGNIFVLKLPQYDSNAKVELVATIASKGGTDSHGEVWMSKD
ncbi:MAG: family 20 glycosylhydrolase [Armatimonadetes bacterium]|nr:family 20 glycosylhydrolase [Armatimonadota bacterium]